MIESPASKIKEKTISQQFNKLMIESPASKSVPRVPLVKHRRILLNIEGYIYS